MNNEHVILFNKDKCIQCMACEVACKTWREVEPGVKWRTVGNVWQGKFPDVKMSPVSVSCVHCVEPACANACPAGAITKRREDGLVLVDRTICTGCRTCFEACPYSVPQFGADGIMQKCDLCAGNANTLSQNTPCIQTCPTQALSFHRTDASGKTSLEISLLNDVKISVKAKEFLKFA